MIATSDVIFLTATFVGVAYVASVACVALNADVINNANVLITSTLCVSKIVASLALATCFAAIYFRLLGFCFVLCCTCRCAFVLRFPLYCGLSGRYFYVLRRR